MRLHCLVTGASSQLGAPVLAELVQRKFKITAWTRNIQAQPVDQAVSWQQADLHSSPVIPDSTNLLIHLAPIDLLPALLNSTSLSGLRIIAISTCSIRFKAQSDSLEERKVAAQLLAAEEEVRQLAKQQGHDLTVLRPSMLYGAGRDGTIAVLQGFVRRFGFLVLPAQATGLRQPVHVDDVAQAIIACVVQSKAAIDKCYELGGADQLSLEQLADYIFTHNQLTPRVFTVPQWLLVGLIALVRYTGLRADWRPGLIARAKQAQIVDNTAAQQDFAYAPRHFDGRFVENVNDDHN